uniref:Uncharacterized protein n=1 Tax=Rhizophora mucronata TaxID=61149 RepID=A0A2P2N9N0_RHIMU
MSGSLQPDLKQVKRNGVIHIQRLD